MDSDHLGLNDFLGRLSGLFGIPFFFFFCTGRIFFGESPGKGRAFGRPGAGAEREGRRARGPALDSGCYCWLSARKKIPRPVLVSFEQFFAAGKFR